LCGSILIIKKIAEVVVVASKESGLEANAEKTEYTVMSQDQNEGQNNKIKVHNKSFETVKQLKYLGTTLTNKIPFMRKSRTDRS
jgi:hypothetical protein